MGVVAFLSGQVALHVEPRYDLEQIILLLSNPLDFCVILARPLNQGRDLLFSLSGVPTGIHLPDSKIGHLPSGSGELGDPLVSGGKLRR
jgi:hypothetical protein